MIRAVVALLTLAGCALPLHFPRGPERCVQRPSTPSSIGDPLAVPLPRVNHSAITARWRRHSCGIYDIGWPLK